MRKQDGAQFDKIQNGVHTEEILLLMHHTRVVTCYVTIKQETVETILKETTFYHNLGKILCYFIKVYVPTRKIKCTE